MNLVLVIQVLIPIIFSNLKHFAKFISYLY